MGTKNSKSNSTEDTPIIIIFNGNIINAEYTNFGGQYTFVIHAYLKKWINAVKHHPDIKKDLEDQIMDLNKKEIHEEKRLVLPKLIRDIISSHNNDEDTVIYLRKFTEIFDQKVIKRVLNLEYETHFPFIHEAGFSGKPKTLEFLHELGANFNVMDHSGRTPIDVVNNVCRCKQGNCEHQKCVQFLEKIMLQCQVCKKAEQVRGHNDSGKVVLCDEHHTNS